MTRLPWLLVLAACAGPGDGDSGEVFPRTRIVMRQFYDNGSVFIVENLAGRDLVEMRSQPVPKGGVPVAWITDREMREALEEMADRDFAEYARPRPSDPKALGARGELTVYDERGRTRSLLRRRGQPRGEVDAYQECTLVFQEVWRANRPRFQAVTGDGDFGVKKAGYRRGR